MDLPLRRGGRADTTLDRGGTARRAACSASIIVSNTSGSTDLRISSISAGVRVGNNRAKGSRAPRQSLRGNTKGGGISPGTAAAGDGISAGAAAAWSIPLRNSSILSRVKPPGGVVGGIVKRGGSLIRTLLGIEFIGAASFGAS